MSQLTENPVSPPKSDEDDPFRYGWRYVRRERADGTTEYEQVPLSWEDVLYPEEDDFVVQKPPHLRDLEYVHGALETFYASRPDIVVLGDCRIDWGVEGLRPLGPDVVVLFGVREWHQRGTFRVAEEGGRPVLVLEIASPSTREHDLESKPPLYYRAGVERYVIVDRGPRGEDPARLLGYRRGPSGWITMEPDNHGRLSLAPVPLLLGLVGDRPWLYDPVTGERLRDRTELVQALADAEARVQILNPLSEQLERAVQGRLEAEEAARRVTQAAEAKERAALEEKAALEQRLRELEERLRQQGQ